MMDDKTPNLIIQKFGGSSVADVSRIQRVARIVRDSVNAGTQVVVVVSAMAHDTDHLDSKAREIGVTSGAELDVLLSSGEQASAALLAMALQKMGIEAASFCGHQVRFVTSSDHQSARLKAVETGALRKAIAQQVVPVVAGFQGVDEAGALTTFGRGGSDLTAVALSAALQARECQIFTDTDGVYTADPRVVTNAQKISEIALPLMAEYAQAGAKVLQSRCLELANKESVPVRVLSSYRGGDGTLLTPELAVSESASVQGIATLGGYSLFRFSGLPDRPGLVSYCLAGFEGLGFASAEVVQLSGVQSSRELLLAAKTRTSEGVLKRLNAFASELGCQFSCLEDGLVKLTIVGSGLTGQLGYFHQACSILSKEGVDPVSISASSSRIEVLLDAGVAAGATRALHEGLVVEPKKTS
jgi:aspartate kinase